MHKLAKKEDTTAIQQVPDYLKHAGPGQGLENVEHGDVTLPRLGLCQALSPQRDKSDPKYINGLEEGLYFNTVTNQVYGESVEIVPLLFYKTRMMFPPMGAGSGILCQAMDGKHGVGVPGGECAVCQYAQFRENTEQGEKKSPPCTLFHNYAALALPEKGLPKLDSLLGVSLKSTGLKVSKDWLALMRLRGTDIFAGVYEFTAIARKNDVGKWYQPVIKPAAWVSPETYAIAKEAYGMVRELQQGNRLAVEQDDMGASEIGREPGEEG